MRKVCIVSDSTCDLSPELLNKYQIKTYPLKVCFNDEVYLDQVDISLEEMYQKVEETGNLPKTAACTILEFVDIFSKLVEEGYDVIYAGIGGKLSSTYQNAVISLQELPDGYKEHVYLLDSGNLSTGIGLLLLRLCEYRDQGLPASEIYEKALQIIPCVRAQFSVKDLTFLHKGGRCSQTAKLLGTLLSIRPILRVFNGKIIASEKIFARKYEKALNFQIEDIKKNIDHVDGKNLFITHSCAEEEAKYIYEQLPKEVKNKFENIYITKAGCVVSAHCGKGTIGILYIKDEPLKDDK